MSLYNVDPNGARCEQHPDRPSGNCYMCADAQGSLKGDRLFEEQINMLRTTVQAPSSVMVPYGEGQRKVFTLDQDEFDALAELLRRWDACQTLITGRIPRDHR